MRDKVDVLFDARHLRWSGIGSYVKTCLYALSRLSSEDGVVCSVIVRPEDRQLLPEQFAGGAFVSAAPMYSLREQAMWQRALLQTRPTLLWLPHYPVPLMARKQQKLVTVHDLLHALPVSEGGPGGLRNQYARAMLRAIAGGNSDVLTVSEFTKSELQAHDPRLQDRVLTTQSEVAPEWFAGSERRQAVTSRPYFIFVGNVVPQKDVGTLLNAFEGVRIALAHDLIIVGGKAAIRSVDRGAADTGQAGVRWLGSVSAAELRGLVAGATALVMPSRYEGLGLPPLEAMAIGTPAIISDAPALIEGAGDAALIFARGNATELAALLTRVATEEDLRAQLRSHGFRQVGGRTRERAVAELMTVIRSELAGHETASRLSTDPARSSG